MTPLWRFARMPSPARKTAPSIAPATPAAPSFSDPVSARFAVFDTAEPRDAAQDALDTFLDAGRSKPSPAQRITGNRALEILAKYDRLPPASAPATLSAEERRLVAAFEIPADQPGKRPTLDGWDDADKATLAQTILRVGQRWGRGS
jgi:hypothetical protein